MVKSGYRVGREMNLHPTRCSNMGEVNKWWKMLWSLQLPPRMKLFGWRVCHNWLPAKTNLCHRRMNVSPVCDLCGSHAETLPHALWNCDKVKVVWKLLPWEKLSRSEFEDSLKIMWAIWENRNRKWNKLPIMNGAQVLHWVFTAYPASNSNPSDDLKTRVASPSNSTHWKALNMGSICANCDAAINPNQIGVGMGFLWHDWNEKVLTAGMVYIPSCCSVTVAEAWAILEAIKGRPSTDTRPFEIRSDCKAVVEAIKNQDNQLSAAGTLIHQIKARLEDSNDYNISFVNRNHNECATMLARKCLATKTSQFFAHFIPGWLAKFCKADCSDIL
ncbi:uncharacterized protein LOC133034471 [Cannabis sativa]|uniref:uncharacterized protein LOC133034471 n=1 Tax=Cannabis sativa TaxID=3483 RepID=UPI0029CA85D8|nr:uncharacterized protein LOC133034471 [Cannabis sativa]